MVDTDDDDYNSEKWAFEGVWYDYYSDSWSVYFFT